MRSAAARAVRHFGVGAFALATTMPLVTAAWSQQTETPYQRSIRQQQLYDLQQQNAREQRQSQQQQADQQWQQALQQQQARQGAAAAQGQAVLRTWQQRPPLAPERNPLLGRWISQGVSSRGGQGMVGMANALLGGITGGMCDSMLGRGVIEFRPKTLVAIGRNGSEQVRYPLDYRGGGSRVVVLPQNAVSFTHMIIDFDSPDHATVAAVGCVLVRVDPVASRKAIQR